LGRSRLVQLNGRLPAAWDLFAQLIGVEWKAEALDDRDVPGLPGFGALAMEATTATRGRGDGHDRWQGVRYSGLSTITSGILHVSGNLIIRAAFDWSAQLWDTLEELVSLLEALTIRSEDGRVWQRDRPKVHFLQPMKEHRSVHFVKN